MGQCLSSQLHTRPFKVKFGIANKDRYLSSSSEYTVDASEKRFTSNSSSGTFPGENELNGPFEDGTRRSHQVQRQTKKVDFLSDSACRENTLDFISSRRQALERAASARSLPGEPTTRNHGHEGEFEGNSESCGPSSSDIRSKQAIRMPDKRRSSLPATLLKRQDSWHTMSLLSDSFGTIEDEDQVESGSVAGPGEDSVEEEEGCDDEAEDDDLSVTKDVMMDVSMYVMMDTSCNYHLDGSATSHTSWGEIGLVF